jgi:predicted dithiol-disulfide oxidoreductase (DUF899 family)
VNFQEEKKALLEEEIKLKMQKEKFKGNFQRIDGKKVSEAYLKRFEESKKEAKEDYDPRKHIINRGSVTA